MDGINKDFYKNDKFFGQNSNAEKVKEFCILHNLSVKAFYTAVFSTLCDSVNCMLLSLDIENNNETVISFIKNCQKQLLLKKNEKTISDIKSKFLFIYQNEHKHEKLLSAARLYLYTDNKK